MKYTLINVEDDDFVAEVLSELNYEIRNGDNKGLEVVETVKSDSKTKGTEIAQLVIELGEWCVINAPLIENVVEGMIAAGLYDMIKLIIGRLKRTPEYIPEKKIEIIQEDSEGKKTTLKITIQDFEKRT